MFNLQKKGLFYIFIAFILMAVGCAHSPSSSRPDDWGSTTDAEMDLSDQTDQAMLQIIIVYGPRWCSHTALRLICPGKPVVFWDPAGGYAKEIEHKVRRRDIIVVNPPDLQTYLQFRWVNYDSAVEVFQWGITNDYAAGLHDILMHGTGKHHPAGQFDTYTIIPFCTTAVSDFLHRFAKEIMNVPGKNFFPHSLARILYKQSPDNVLFFKREGGSTVLVQQNRKKTRFSSHP